MYSPLAIGFTVLDEVFHPLLNILSIWAEYISWVTGSRGGVVVSTVTFDELLDEPEELGVDVTTPPVSGMYVSCGGLYPVSSRILSRSVSAPAGTQSLKFQIEQTI